jgi:TDG/mug DNA glycosylase family protein
VSAARNIVLEDVLAPNLALVICGSGAGQRSAQLGQYYAGPGNRFWVTLAETRLTPRLLAPFEYRLLLSFGIGLTDIVKGQAGSDAELDFTRSSPEALRDKILRFSPRYLCFNGKRAAQVFLECGSVGFGIQPEAIGPTSLFVAPSTSGAARRFWDVGVWHQIASLAKAAA